MTNETWTKKGLIIYPQINKKWMQSHAMIPTILYLQDNLYRVYFSGRDCHNRSIIGYAELEILNHEINVLRYSDKPVLSIWPTVGQILILVESVIRFRLRQLNLSRFDIFTWVATKDF